VRGRGVVDKSSDLLFHFAGYSLGHCASGQLPWLGDENGQGGLALIVKQLIILAHHLRQLC
jgi:hypothetical protein